MSSNGLHHVTIMLLPIMAQNTHNRANRVPFSISYETWREPMCARSHVILIAAGAVLWHYDVVLLLLLQCCNQSEQHNARDTMGQGPASGSIMS